MKKSYIKINISRSRARDIKGNLADTVYDVHVDKNKSFRGVANKFIFALLDALQGAGINDEPAADIEDVKQWIINQGEINE